MFSHVFFSLSSFSQLLCIIFHLFLSKFSQCHQFVWEVKQWNYWSWLEPAVFSMEQPQSLLTETGHGDTMHAQINIKEKYEFKKWWKKSSDTEATYILQQPKFDCIYTSLIHPTKMSETCFSLGRYFWWLCNAFEGKHLLTLRFQGGICSQQGVKEEVSSFCTISAAYKLPDSHIEVLKPLTRTQQAKVSDKYLNGSYFLQKQNQGCHIQLVSYFFLD